MQTDIIERKYIGQDIEEISKHVRVSEKPFIFNSNVIGYPFNLVDLVYSVGKEFIPDGLGIYHLFYKDKLVYIGMARNVRTRLIQHLKCSDMVFDNVLWFMTPYLTVEQVLQKESTLIRIHNPPLNISQFYKNSKLGNLYSEGEIIKLLESIPDEDLCSYKKRELISKLLNSRK